jgi:4-amino-4-deoxy-L-arabinose transferase-like glycosyltransferase
MRRPAPRGSGARRPHWPIALIACAVVARLAVVASLDPLTWVDGSDAPYYLRQAWTLARDPQGIPPVAPAYVGALSLAWRAVPGAPRPDRVETLPRGLLAGVRLAQVAASVGMIVALAGLAGRLTGRRRHAAIVAAGLGLGPALVLEPFRILTETLALASLAAALAAWLWPARTTGRAATAGLLWGLAALTRPVLFGLPWLLVACDVWRAAPAARGARARQGLLALACCALVVSPWVLSLRSASGRWIPQGFAANLWIGATGDGRWLGAARTDAQRQTFRGGPDDYLGETGRIVRTDPLGWLATRARNLGLAVVQPHFASDMGGVSVRAAAGGWLRGDASFGALVQALAGTSGLAKLALYLWHWIGLLFGVAGLWLARRRVHEAVPLLLVAAYFTGVHALLTALPRYLLPVHLVLWIGVAWFVDRVQRGGPDAPDAA